MIMKIQDLRFCIKKTKPPQLDLPSKHKNFGEF